MRAVIFTAFVSFSLVACVTDDDDVPTQQLVEDEATFDDKLPEELPEIEDTFDVHIPDDAEELPLLERR